MPVYEFDEFENSRPNPERGNVVNYWGYSTVGFFAPKAGYAATGKLGCRWMSSKLWSKTCTRMALR